MKRNLLIILVLLTSSFTLSTFADNCTQTFTGSGDDDDPTVVTVLPGNISCTTGGTITGITLNNAAGNLNSYYCGNWYDFDLIVDGVTIISGGCKSDFDGTVISVPFTSIVVQSNDLDDYGDYITITFDLEIVYTPSACPAPSNLTVSGETTATADLSWAAASGATGYNWEVVPYGNGQGVGVVSSGSTSGTTAMATGLTASTMYDAYVQNDCGSAYTGSTTFTTSCEAISTFPYTQDFQNGGDIPICWVNDPDDAGGNWEFTTYNSHGPSGDHTTGSGYYALLNDYSTATSKSPFNLITPIFDFTSGGSYQIRYWAWIGSASASNPIHIDVSSDGGSTWNSDVFMNDHSITNTWTEYTVLLSTYTTNQVVVRFRGVSIWGYGTDNSGIDDVTIEIAPTCIKPSDLTVANITATSADLGWTDNAGTSLWDIELGLAGFTPSGTPTESGVSNPYNYGGLTEVTDYEWYVRADCGDGDYSDWEGPVSFSTPPACPQPTNQITSGITTTTADLGWTDNAGATTWDIELGPAGFTPTGTPTEYYVSNPFTYPGLTENTDYDWYVRANCGGAPTGPHALGDYSEWEGPYGFSTACNAVAGFPFYEGFENGGLIPDCWTIEHVEGTSDWTYDSGGQYGHPSGPFTGSYNALLYHPSSSSPAVTKLVSPPMDLSTATFPYLIFWHTQANWPNDQDELRVYYKTSAAGAWTLIPGAVWTDDIPEWTSEAFPLPEPSAEYYIAFEGTGQFGYGVAIDEVRVEASPPVPVSDWAVYIAIFLITIAIWFRFRSRI